MKSRIRSSPSSGVKVQGVILGIAAENLLPDTSKITSVPSGNSSPFSKSCDNTRPGASSDSTKLIVGSIYEEKAISSASSIFNPINCGILIVGIS